MITNHHSILRSCWVGSLEFFVSSLGSRENGGAISLTCKGETVNCLYVSLLSYEHLEIVVQNNLVPSARGC